MKLIFLGPPGAGKGTLAGLVSRELGVPQVSTGDIFRDAIKRGTELGKKVQEIVGRGDLVPDQLTVSLVKERLAQPDAAAGYILDGFPRTIPQADALEAAKVKIDKVINFNIADEVIIRRLSGRRVSKKTGKIYNVNPGGIPAPPPDMPKDELFQRDDDKPEAISNRLVVYRKQTEPLIAYYTKKKLLVNVDGNRDLSPIADEVKKALKK